MYNFDRAASLREWLKISQGTDERGRSARHRSHVGTTMGNARWDSVSIELPYQLYRFTGEKVIEENAEAIERYFDFRSKKAPGTVVALADGAKRNEKRGRHSRRRGHGFAGVYRACEKAESMFSSSENGKPKAVFGKD
ncbi:MAG: hypothetical protein ACLRSW_11815 [Christensenellaceae bacterium]